MGVLKPAIRIIAALAATAAVVTLAACGAGDSQDEADLVKGRTLFGEGCAQCHTLAEARAFGEIGPDLDATFAQARFAGMNDATIEGVVRQQIALPRQRHRSAGEEDEVQMPANIFTGDDARDVAAYVGMVAGVPGIQPPEFDPPEFFSEACATCHALGAAGATGQPQFPNLDERLPDLDPEAIRSIVRSGAPPMPAFGEDQITDEELDELIEFLLGTVNGGG